jgi:hypothetical protein
LKLARSATRPTSTSPDAIDLSWITDLQTVASAAADAEAAAQRDVDRHADKVRMHERRTAEAQRVADGFARELANAREKHDAALTALTESAKKRKAAAENTRRRRPEYGPSSPTWTCRRRTASSARHRHAIRVRRDRCSWCVAVLVRIVAFR